MSVTRRSFLERATVTIFAGAVLPGAFAQTGKQVPDSSSSPGSSSFFDNISAETFKPFIGLKFSVALSGRPRGSLTLAAVTQLPTPKTPASFASKSATTVLDTFTLRFQGSGVPLPQQTYTLSQLSLGSFPLLLVPGSSDGSPTYTAVFNLIKP